MAWVLESDVLTRIAAPRAWNDLIDLPLSLFAKMPYFLLEMRSHLQTYFAELLPSYDSMKHSMTHEDMLELATSVFQGQHPRAVNCLPYHLTYRGTDTMPYTSQYNANSPSLEQCWHYDKVSAAILKDIILKCGLDPTTCTHEQLEEADAYVVCLPCCEAGSQYGPTMKWNQAVRGHLVLL